MRLLCQAREQARKPLPDCTSTRSCGKAGICCSDWCIGLFVTRLVRGFSCRPVFYTRDGYVLGFVRGARVVSVPSFYGTRVVYVKNLTSALYGLRGFLLWTGIMTFLFGCVSGWWEWEKFGVDSFVGSIINSSSVILCLLCLWESSFDHTSAWNITKDVGVKSISGSIKYCLWRYIILNSRAFLPMPRGSQLWQYTLWLRIKLL